MKIIIQPPETTPALTIRRLSKCVLCFLVCILFVVQVNAAPFRTSKVKLFESSSLAAPKNLKLSINPRTRYATLSWEADTQPSKGRFRIEGAMYTGDFEAVGEVFDTSKLKFSVVTSVSNVAKSARVQLYGKSRFFRIRTLSTSDEKMSVPSEIILGNRTETEIKSKKVTLGQTPPPSSPGPANTPVPTPSKTEVSVEPTPVSSSLRSLYVSPSGNDNASGLTTSEPFKSIQKAVNVALPGDAINVMNGTYTHLPAAGESNVVVITRSGTPDKWIKLQAMAGHKPKIKFKYWGGIAFFGSASYWEVSGFEVEGSSVEVGYDSALRQKDIMQNSQTTGSGIGFDGYNTDPKLKPHHIKVFNNLVHHSGGCGICSARADYLTISDNVVHSNCWTTNNATSGISLYQNWNYDNAPGYHMIISGNLVYGNRTFIPWFATKALSDGNGIIVDDARNTQNGSPFGKYSGRTLITNNVSFNNGGGGINLFLSDKIDVINNTTYQNAASPELDWSDMSFYDVSDVIISNNIFIPRSNRLASGNPASSASTNVVLNNNIYMEGKSAENLGGTNIKADPKFTSASTNSGADFRPRNDSPAIDKGTNANAPSVDIDKVKRPLGAGIDIGAYEIK
jgi:hypothetical protein